MLRDSVAGLLPQHDGGPDVALLALAMVSTNAQRLSPASYNFAGYYKPALLLGGPHSFLVW